MDRRQQRAVAQFEQAAVAMDQAMRARFERRALSEADYIAFLDGRIEQGAPLVEERLRVAGG